MFYSIAVLLLGLVALVFVTILTDYRIVKVDVFAKKTAFSISPENIPDEHSLLNTGMWTKKLIVENFQPIELYIDSVISSNHIGQINNPVTISPNQRNNKIIFTSDLDDMTVQDITCESRADVAVSVAGNDVIFEITNATDGPKQSITLTNHLDIFVQGCSVIDSKANNLTHLFQQTISVKLNKLSTAFDLFGRDGQLRISIEKDTLTKNIDFMVGLYIEDVDFLETDYETPRKISTIDSVSVVRKFPFEAVVHKSKNEGDLQVMTEHEFQMFELSLRNNLIRFRGEGRLSSFKVGGEELGPKLIPGLVQWITGHPVMSMIISIVGWLGSIIIPILVKEKLKKV